MLAVVLVSELLLLLLFDKHNFFITEQSCVDRGILRDRAILANRSILRDCNPGQTEILDGIGILGKQKFSMADQSWVEIYSSRQSNPGQTEVFFVTATLRNYSWQSNPG